MFMKNVVSRRTFVRNVAATAALLGLQPTLPAQSTSTAPRPGAPNDYDRFAKLASNENPYGPTEPVLSAMTDAFKYANRYRYPDPGIVQAIAALHGVAPDNVLIGAGSSEILHIAASAFLSNGKQVIGAEPTYSSVYEFATGLKTNAVRLPLREDYHHDTPALIKAINANAKDIGLVYVCNPNNPTGLVVPKQEIKQLLDEIPREIPVLIDEAYHDFVDDPDYATSVPHVIDGRPVVISRTFSKIFGLAGMRLGYALAPAGLIAQMRPHSSGSNVNAIVKFGGVAALKDVAGQEKVRNATLKLRKTITTQLQELGYAVIPSQGNFVMVHIRRPVLNAIQDFRARGVLVGRPFPPMLEHVRVSIGTPEEMERFLTAFKEIVRAGEANG
jgi:histidinol-phosphate aminotransferase